MVRAEHVVCGGASDGGKTTELRRMAHVYDGAVVWCNHTAGEHESFETAVPGRSAEDRKEMQQASGKYQEWSEVRINLKIHNINQCVRTAIGYAVDVYDTTRAKGNPVSVMIIVDECHHLDEELLGWLLSEGRDKGIKAVLATQNVKKLKGHPDLGNARYFVWVGEWANMDKGYLDYYGFPRESDDPKVMPGERFHIDVFDRQMNHLAHGRTDPDYGA